MSNGSTHMADADSRILFGAAYYPEYLPSDRLEHDLDLMLAANFTVIRVGESVWSRWEPRPGDFHLDWLRPTLDAAHTRGISVIVGTPTYAAPPWLLRRYPEFTAQRRTGVPIPYGHRQDIDVTHPGFVHLADRVVRAIVSQYAPHPAVVGWQVDNEPGNELLHNRAVHDQFIDYLRQRYDTVEELNRAWGLVYWAHELERWDDLWPADGNTVPSYDLAWRRFQAELVTRFISHQADVVRESARGDQFVTTCLAIDRPAVDAVGLGQTLDVTATNIYFNTQDALHWPAANSEPNPLTGPGWTAARQVSELYLLADRSRGVQQRSFLVTETNAGSIDDACQNFPPFPGQLRQAAWALISRGARMVEYWHWHTNHFGNETFWGGVLGHSLQPGRVYGEIKQLGAEISRLTDELTSYQPTSDAAILFSTESSWAQQFQPPLRRPGTDAPDPGSYDRFVKRFHFGLFSNGIGADVVAPEQLPSDPAETARRWPLLVAAGLYIASDETLAHLAAYAHAGGHLILGPRTGYADEECWPRRQVMPGALRAAVGARYDEVSNLAGPLPLAAESSPRLPITGSAEDWIELLEADDAEVLARYEHPFFGRYAAITTHQHGQGRVSYVGCLPSRDLAQEFGRWLADVSLPEPAWRELPASVVVSRGRDGRGNSLHFVHNWSDRSLSVTCPFAGRDLLAERDLALASEVHLNAWDVRIIRARDNHS